MSIIILGAVFGFLLSCTGATSPDFYANLFLFNNLQLLWVISTAVFVGIIGVLILKKISTRSIVCNTKLKFDKRPMKQELVYGALLFGLGW